MIEIYVLDWAARKGHAEVVKVLINFTADPNAPDKDGNTPIHFAAMEGHLDVVKALIAFVYPPNVKNKLGKTPIYYASMNGYAEIVKILSEFTEYPNEPDRHGNTPIHFAAIEGHSEVVKVLARYTNNANAANFHGNTPMHFAAMKGHLTTVVALTKLTNDPNPLNLLRATPLHYASVNGHSEVVDVLVTLVANPLPIIDSFNDLENLPPASTFCPTTMDNSDPPGEVNDLLDMIDTLNALDNEGRTSQLHVAALNGHSDTVKTLSALSDNANTPNDRGRTPIHYAASRGHTEVVNFLALCTNDPNAPDHAGDTPIQMATKKGHVDTVKALAKHTYAKSGQDENKNNTQAEYEALIYSDTVIDVTEVKSKALEAPADEMTVLKEPFDRLALNNHKSIRFDEDYQTKEKEKSISKEGLVDDFWELDLYESQEKSNFVGESLARIKVLEKEVSRSQSTSSPDKMENSCPMPTSMVTHVVGNIIQTPTSPTV